VQASVGWSDVVDASGPSHICPKYVLGLRGVGQFGCMGRFEGCGWVEFLSPVTGQAVHLDVWGRYEGSGCYCF
jgi:hypothetical protein